MTHLLRRTAVAIACCLSIGLHAQTTHTELSPQRLYHEGRELFRHGDYAAARMMLNRYLHQSATTDDARRMEADYMLACTSYELQEPHCIEVMEDYLQRHPDAPQANRVQALIGSALFYQQDYKAALTYFEQVQPEQLTDRERDDATYRRAVCHLQTGHLTDAAIWLETLRHTSPRYADDCTYHLSYIRYTQQRYDEALKGFLSIQASPRYTELAPYYIAETYLAKKHYDKAEIMAQNFLSAHPHHELAVQMYRIEGTAHYHYGRYREALDDFRRYLAATPLHEARRDALYLYGLSCYRCGVYSEMPDVLTAVTGTDDALSQNAYLHIGLAYLQMGDKAKARMAFEQAAASPADPAVQEQAAYNYALTLHDTSYSAFGESVTAFERFLNNYPHSAYADRISSYLVDVYTETRNYHTALQSIERIQHPTPQILSVKADILYQLGTEAFANADYPTAINYFRQAIHQGQTQPGKKPQTADACYWTGESYYRLNQLAEASRYYQSAIASAAKDTRTYRLARYGLGYIAFHQRQYEQAKAHFAQCLSTSTTDEDRRITADACNRLGDCYLYNRHFEEAKPYYRRAENLHTTGGDYACYQLALVAGLQKDYPGKITLLNRLANHYPQSPYLTYALYEKGRSFVQNRDNGQAIETFRQLTEQYPESSLSRKAATEIGLLQYQDGHYDEAIRTYTEVIRRYPGSEEARLAMRDLKSIFVDANRVEEYAALAEQMPQVFHFEPNEQDSLTYRAAEQVYMKGQTASARKSFQRYLQSFPDGAFHLNARYYLCLIAYQQKDDKEVMEQSAQLLAYPESPYTEEVLPLRGEVAFKQQQYDEALSTYKLMLAKASTGERKQQALTGILRCATALKDPVETIQAATRLLAEEKLDEALAQEALYARAKAYLDEKATAKAQADLSILAKDTRTRYGAEAKYQVAQLLYDAGDYAAAEKEIMDFIEQSTPHAYWLARSFVLLADTYIAMGKNLDARQYLLSLQQNYQAEDDIAGMIEKRLNKLEELNEPENASDNNP